MMGRNRNRAGFVDRLDSRLAFLPFGVQRKVDHHDRVFLDDADQENDADQRNDAEFRPAEQQREQRADAGGGERRENRQGVDVTFIQHAEHDVDGHERGQNQQRLAG